MIFGDLLFDNLNTNADRIALVQGQKSFTYREFCGLVNFLSDHLHKSGVRKGDKVGLYLPNSIELAVSFFAVSEVGAVCVPINHKYKQDEIRTCIEQSDSKYLLTNEQLSRGVRSFDFNVEVIVVNKDEAVATEQITRKTPQVISSDDVIYLFSTGSTGIPKCVCRKHSNLLALADNYTQTVGWTNDDKVLIVIPLSHTYAFGNFISAVKVGAAVYLIEDFNRKQVCNTLSDEEITVFPAVPFMLDMLSTYSSAESKNFSNLKHVISAGSRLDEAVADRFFKIYKSYPRQLYGSSESGVISINMASEAADHCQSVGKPVANVVVRVVDDDGSQKSRGDLGEIVVSSLAVAPGYLNLEDETKKVFKDGFYYTGDIGFVDDEGYIYLKGRKKLFVNIGGLKVDPIEVENVLLTHKDVEEAAVTGIISENGNEVIVAYVVRKRDVAIPDLIEFCKGKISDFKIPRSIKFVDHLPKSPTGKILRSSLIK